jgi:hypothetical protein
MADDPTPYDSTADTLKHALRVGELMSQLITELINRSLRHDRSKTEDPELATFNEFTPKLRDSTYDSEEYKGYLASMKIGLDHHYASNRHHPEFVDRDIEWRPVVGYEGLYEVSSKGDVRSVARIAARSGTQGNLRIQAKIRKAQVTPKGYHRVQLTKDGKARNHLVHVLVATAFLENPSQKPEVNHKNGNKGDNRVGNLEWATTGENLQHAYDTGLREPAVKYVVHCPELDLTTFGTQQMESKLLGLGYERAQSAGIWRAMDTGGTHLGLRFEGTAIQEYRRSQISGMTLVDLIEMLADWRAATERHADGSLTKSLAIQRKRFGISDQLNEVLWNTAREFRWLDNQPCGAVHTAIDGAVMTCNVSIDGPEGHDGDHCDGRFEPYTWPSDAPTEETDR